MPMFEIHPTDCPEAKEERAHLRVWVVRVLAQICLAGLAGWATRAYSVDIPLYVVERNGVEIRLMDTPCIDPVSLSMVKPDYHHRLKAIDSIWPQRDGTRKRFVG